MNKIRIRSFPRIHITLIGMNDDGYRINGGIGFSIKDPHIDCLFEESDCFSINDLRQIIFTTNEANKLIQKLNNIKKCYSFEKAMTCSISGGALPHYGFGSNSAIYLSCVEALFLLNDAEYDFETITIASGRGGTSGIGVNTYFNGGFVFDVGIKNENTALRPSSQGQRETYPLILHKCKAPEWRLGICIPLHIEPKSEQEEVSFFNKYCPIEITFVKEILYEAVYGVTSAIAEDDKDIFCKSINRLQKTKWKNLERQLYDTQLITLESEIISLGALSVGMSSLGPMLFFLGEDIEDIPSRLKDKFTNIICFTTTINNEPRIIIND